MGRNALKQLHLFNVEEDKDTVDVATHKCKECGEVKPIRSFNTKNIIPPQKKEGSFYPVRRQTHEGDVQLFVLFNTCRECDAKGRAGRHARERMYSKPPEGYRCPICKKNEEEILNNQVIVDKDYNVYKRRYDLKSAWHIDHDHKTGEFRGWLCRNCNTGLGSLGDNIEGLERGIKYLKGELSDI